MCTQTGGAYEELSGQGAACGKVSRPGLPPEQWAGL